MRAQASIAVGQLGDHRHVEVDAVALAHAEALEHVGEPLHVGEEVGVGDGAGVAGLALPVVGDPVAVAGGDVAVEAVRRDVELCRRRTTWRRAAPTRSTVSHGRSSRAAPPRRPRTLGVGGGRVAQRAVGHQRLRRGTRRTAGTCAPRPAGPRSRRRTRFLRGVEGAGAPGKLPAHPRHRHGSGPDRLGSGRGGAGTTTGGRTPGSSPAPARRPEPVSGQRDAVEVAGVEDLVAGVGRGGADGRGALGPGQELVVAALVEGVELDSCSSVFGHATQNPGGVPLVPESSTSWCPRRSGRGCRPGCLLDV